MSQLGSDVLAVIHNQHIDSLYGQKRKRHGHSPILEMSINSESLILGVASCKIQGLSYGLYP
jgi:hypothetical protein